MIIVYVSVYTTSIDLKSASAVHLSEVKTWQTYSRKRIVLIIWRFYCQPGSCDVSNADLVYCADGAGGGMPGPEEDGS